MNLVNSHLIIDNNSKQQNSLIDFNQGAKNAYIN